MDALDLWTKRNIQDYFRRPESKFDKDYPKKDKKLERPFEEDKKTKKMGGVIDWGIF